MSQEDSDTESYNADDKLSSLQQALKNVLPDAKFPNPKTVVTGALDVDKVARLAESGVDVVFNLQPEEELEFAEAEAVEANGMTYEHLPIADANDLKQVNLLNFDRILRQHQGKTMLIHCKSGNRVGACMALRAGWLRGRKMDTAIEQGKEHGLTGLEDEVFNRLLVPR